MCSSRGTVVRLGWTVKEKLTAAKLPAPELRTPQTSPQSRKRLHSQHQNHRWKRFQ